MKSYVVDMNGLSESDELRVFNLLDKIGFIGAQYKPHTKFAYVFIHESSIDKLSSLLGIDSNRITDASHWDMNSWLNN